MPLYAFEGKRPVVHHTAFVHETATLVGSVTVGADCYVGPGAVLRGDWGSIVIGEGSNIQENVVVHARPEEVTSLAANSHVGHCAILHGCVLDEHVLVGMGAIINDGVRVGADSFIAAGAVITPNTEVPAGSMVMGVPAKVVGEVRQALRDHSWLGTRLYQTLPARYHASLERLDLEDCRPDQTKST